MAEFMNLAESTKKRIGDEDYIMSPCSHCANTESREVTDVEWHLLSRGSMDGYTRWTRHGEEQVMDEYTQGCEMPNPSQCHMDVESNIRAEASSYQWNTRKPKRPLENQDVDAYDDDLDMPDFAAMIAYFKGPKKDMIGYKDLQPLMRTPRKNCIQVAKGNIPS
jgi:hypothetical protein